MSDDETTTEDENIETNEDPHNLGEESVDDLSKRSRDELNYIARGFEIEEPEKFKNKTQLATAILAKYDEADDSPGSADDDNEEMLDDPKLSDVKRWEVVTTVQSVNQRGKRKIVMPSKNKKRPAILTDIPNAMAQDLHRRAALEPVLR